ncbi:hypothetical protein [Streptomyces sp. NPDC053367]|uniref:hypothetical protein n=1 Tax=Streptomyces sp. NPDC053367 TaxID=3365700 RepID=UPI0037D05D38
MSEMTVAAPARATRDTAAEQDLRMASLAARAGLEPELAQRFGRDPYAVLAEFGLVPAQDPGCPTVLELENLQPYDVTAVANPTLMCVNDSAAVANPTLMCVNDSAAVANPTLMCVNDSVSVAAPTLMCVNDSERLGRRN